MADELGAALVTGAARGIGLAAARRLSGLGMKVAMVDVLAEPLNAAVEEVAAGGPGAVAIPCDVTEPRQVQSMVERAESELGPLSLLINNAGTFSYIGPVWQAPPERWFRDTRVSLFGSFLCCRYVVERLVARKSGRVINMVSAGGVGDPHAFCTSYAVGKTALMRLTEGLSAELVETGVKVFALAPPAIDTDMTRFIMDDDGGRKYRPGFGEHFSKPGAFRPVEVVTRWVEAIATGQADALAGRYLLATEGVEETLARAEEIVQKDLLTLRIRN